MSFKDYEESVYGLDLDLVTIPYTLHILGEVGWLEKATT